MTSSFAAPPRPVRDLAALPAWRWWVVGSFLARSPTTMVVIALVLSGRLLGSYGLGAALAGLYMLGAGVGARWRGRALDRRELRRGIAGNLVATSAMFAVTAVLVGVRAPVVLVAAAVVAAGVASSAVTAAYRSFLPDVVHGPGSGAAGQADPALLGTAYALDAVLLEVGFVTGPALAGGIALLVGPVGALWAMVGFGLVAAWVARARLPDRQPVVATEGAAPPPWSDPLVVANYLVTFAVGTMVGLLEAGFAPLAVLLGAEDGVAGLCSAAYALGSGIGGVVVTTRLGSRAGSGRLALALVVVLGLLMVPVAAAPGVLQLIGLLVVAGLPFATVNAVAMTHLQARLHPARVTEGFALTTTAVLVGVAAGNGLASALLAAEASPRLLYLVAAVPPLGAVAAVAAWSAARRPTPSPTS